MGKRKSRRKTRKQRGGNRICTVCAKEFDYITDTDYLNHCVNAHTPGSSTYKNEQYKGQHKYQEFIEEMGGDRRFRNIKYRINKTTLNPLSASKRVGLMFADMCGANLIPPHTFTQKEFNDRFVPAEEGKSKEGKSNIPETDEEGRQALMQKISLRRARASNKQGKLNFSGNDMHTVDERKRRKKHHKNNRHSAGNFSPAETRSGGRKTRRKTSRKSHKRRKTRKTKKRRRKK